MFVKRVELIKFASIAMTFERLNAYHIMWLFVMFDLPVISKKERKDAALFPKDHFFRDYASTESSKRAEEDLLRLCDVHVIPYATNIATAEVLIHGLERGDLDWRNVGHPQV